MTKSNTALSPVLYLPHGGGPMPLLGDERHGELVTFLKKVGPQLGTPKAIVVISAHWEEERVTVTSGGNPEIIYDYYGFPEEAYQIKYPAPGDPQLARAISAQLQDADILSELQQRGFDHGLFVPLKLMFPEAKIPCIQISLLRSLSATDHIAIGKSLSFLKQEDVLVIGSGSSFHNMQAFFGGQSGDTEKKADEFNRWLMETCSSEALSAREREDRLIHWEKAPSARFCHPREEHLLPLQVCYGIVSDENSAAEVVFNQRLMGVPMSGFMWR